MRTIPRLAPVIRIVLDLTGGRKLLPGCGRISKSSADRFNPVCGQVAPGLGSLI
jgi:hypothetical protein